MNNASLIQLLSVVITAIASSGAVAAVFNRRNRRERLADIDNRKAETDNVSAQAAATALAALRKELDAANADLDRRRTIIQGQDERIDAQARQIRRLRGLVEDLREHARLMEIWVRRASQVMRESGLEPPPLPLMPWLQTEQVDQIERDEGGDSGPSVPE